MIQLRFTLLSLIIVLSILSDLCAQGDFKNGFIITNTRDTLDVLIEHDKWYFSPEEIRCKKAANAKIDTLSPADVLFFFVDGELYQSSDIQIELSSKYTNSLEDNSALKLSEPFKAFVQVLFKGELGLYIYRSNKKGENFFYVSGIDDKLELLGYKKYQIHVNDIPVVRENNQFIGQLILMMDSCGDIKQSIDQTRYNSKSLLKLFEKYSTCKNNEIQFINKEKEYKSNYGFTIGLSSNSIHIDGPRTDYLVDAALIDKSNKLNLSVFVEFEIPRTDKQWYWHYELMLSSYKSVFEYEYDGGEFYYEKQTSTIDHTYLKNLFGTNLNLNVNQNGNVFFRGGLSIGYLISRDNLRVINLKRYGEFLPTSYSDVIDKYFRFNIGGYLGAGYSFNNVLAEYRIELSTGFSPYKSTLDIYNSSHLFLLGYKF